MKKRISVLMAIFSAFCMFFVTACGGEKKAAHQHDYVAVQTIEATCTERGYTEYECQCGDKKIDGYIEALGHAYTDIPVAATCIQKGHVAHICKKCGESYSDTYTEGYGKHSGYGTCATCQKTIFSLFAEIIKKNGEMDEEGDYIWNEVVPISDMMLYIGVTLSGDLINVTFLHYDANVAISWMIEENGGTDYFYLGKDLSVNYEMYGRINAKTWTKNSVVGYTETNIPASLISDARDLMSSMMDISLTMLKNLLINENLTIENLGFIVY